jgi:hypothetical protein
MTSPLTEETFARGRSIKGIDEKIACGGIDNSMRALVLFSNNGMPGWQV